MGRWRKLLKRLRFLLPSKLPRGSQDFQNFCDSLFETYDIPKTDSYYHSIAVMIQHLPPTTVFKSKSWFAASIFNAQAREVAFYKIQEIQKRDKEKQEADTEASQKASKTEEKDMPH